MIDALNGNPMARALGVALLQFVWQGAVLSAMTGLALYLFRGQSANARYTVACLGLLALLAAPIVTMATSTADPSAGRPMAMSIVDGHDLGAQTTPGGVSGSPDTSAGGVLSRFWDRTRIDRQLPVIVAVWGFGVLLLTLQLAGSWLLVEGIRRGATRPIAHVSDTYVQTLAARLHVTRRLRLAESARVAVPTVIGWLRPLILVPSSALAGLSPFQLQAIIAHEIAHIRRHDYIVNVLQSLVETLLFYHPGVWWISKQIRLEREQSCDDLAADVCGDRVAYARALASLEESRADAPRLALAANGGDLVTRIRRLLGGPQPATPRSSFMVIGLSIATMSLVFVGPPTALGARAARIDPAPAVANPASALSATTPLSPPARPQVARDQPQVLSSMEVERAERQFVVARMQHDVSAFSQLLTDEFVGTNQNGVTANKAATVDFFRTAPMSSLSQVLSDVRVSNGIAVVTGSTVEGNAGGSDRMLFTHVWRISGTSWKLVSSSQFRDPRVAQSAPSTSPTPFGAPGVQLNKPNQPQQEVAAYERAYLEAVAPPLPPPPAGVPLRVGGDIKEPKKLIDVKPVYPQIAMAANVQGIVILEIVLDEQGGVASAKILRSQPLLDQAAIDAVRQWKFTPTLLNGAPVAVMMTVTVNFSLQ